MDNILMLFGKVSALVVFFLTGFSWYLPSAQAQAARQPMVVQEQFQVPVLTGKSFNPLVRIKITVPGTEEVRLRRFDFCLEGTTRLADLKDLSLYYVDKDSSLGSSLKTADAQILGRISDPKKKISFDATLTIQPGVHYFWLSAALQPAADLLHEADASCIRIVFGTHRVQPLPEPRNIRQKFGVAVRQPNDDGVHTYRIPGLTTTKQGSLLAVYDMRRDKSRDLQGNIDIGLSRSTNGGQTWEPMKVVMDMGTWGGLPESFNGVSDANILSDDKTGTIYLAGLWMHGVLDKNGKWIEGLTVSSSAWNHQWRDKGSQPGYDVKQTSQFLIVKSTDDGKTWSNPVNITQMGKKEDWWLWAPGPGHGITLEDGTLVFPTQGRDKTGRPFSNITYSTDGGKNWVASAPADTGSTTESMAVQLTDGSIMLNMRANENRGRKGSDNGRSIAITRDLGKTWASHTTSRHVLNEPVCMASLHKHVYAENGNKKSLLFFSNPNTESGRHHMTIKVSKDDGMTWPPDLWLLLDEWSSFGYSCLTSVDENTIGILYEGSGAHMVFQKISLKDWLDKH
jgi:sialidase-1